MWKFVHLLLESSKCALVIVSSVCFKSRGMCLRRGFSCCHTVPFTPTSFYNQQSRQRTFIDRLLPSLSSVSCRCFPTFHLVLTYSPDSVFLFPRFLCSSVFNVFVTSFFLCCNKVFWLLFCYRVFLFFLFFFFSDFLTLPTTKK